MGNYKLSQDAKTDLKRIYKYGVRKFGEGYHRSPCGSDNIYYRIENNSVEIMNIIGKQDIEKQLKNLGLE